MKTKLFELEKQAIYVLLRNYWHFDREKEEYRKLLKAIQQVEFTFEYELGDKYKKQIYKINDSSYIGRSETIKRLKKIFEKSNSTEDIEAIKLIEKWNNSIEIAFTELDDSLINT